MPLIVATRDADAQCHTNCLLGWDWTAYSEIPVWIHPDLADNLVRLDGTKWTWAELRREVEYSLETLDENLPRGGPPLRVMTSASSGYDWDDPIAGAIHVVPDLMECTGEDAGTCDCFGTGSLGGSGPTNGLLLRIKRSETGFVGGVNQNLVDCDKTYEHRVADATGLHTLRGVLKL